jgi:SAM-dependent methyltransferase
VGCSSGALAREFKKVNSASHYLGIEIDPSYTELASRFCDQTVNLDIELADESFWQEVTDRDCWIFGDTLEHLKDPWHILRKIRSVIPTDGCVVACIPNAQHWSLQAKLAIGDFRYANAGLLDRTHLRWFTRQTILELFRDTGFQVKTGFPRIFDEPKRNQFLPIIENMAEACGVDPKQASADASALQYVIRAEPV